MRRENPNEVRPLKVKACLWTWFLFDLGHSSISCLSLECEWIWLRESGSSFGFKISSFRLRKRNRNRCGWFHSQKSFDSWCFALPPVSCFSVLILVLFPLNSLKRQVSQQQQVKKKKQDLKSFISHFLSQSYQVWIPCQSSKSSIKTEWCFILLLIFKSKYTKTTLITACLSPWSSSRGSKNNYFSLNETSCWLINQGVIWFSTQVSHLTTNIHQLLSMFLNHLSLHSELIIEIPLLSVKVLQAVQGQPRHHSRQDLECQLQTRRRLQWSKSSLNLKHPWPLKIINKNNFFKCLCSQPRLQSMLRVVREQSNHSLHTIAIVIVIKITLAITTL